MEKFHQKIVIQKKKRKFKKKNLICEMKRIYLKIKHIQKNENSDKNGVDMWSTMKISNIHTIRFQMKRGEKKKQIRWIK